MTKFNVQNIVEVITKLNSQSLGYAFEFLAKAEAKSQSSGTDPFTLIRGSDKIIFELETTNHRTNTKVYSVKFPDDEEVE